MSVTAAAGFVAAGIAAGIKASGDPDLSLVATDDGRPVAAAGVFTRNLMTAAPVRVTRDHLRTAAGRAAAVVLNSGNANAATGEPGMRDATAMCAGVAAELGVDRHQVLVCSTGLIGIPMPIGRDRGGDPRPGGGPHRRRGRGRRHRHHDHRHPRQAGGGHRRRLHRRRHGQGGGDALAQHGHHAGRAHHRRRGDPGAAEGRPHPRRRALLQHPRRRRVHLHQRHRAPPGQRAGRRGRPRRPARRGRRRLPLPGRADGRRRRGRHQGGALRGRRRPHRRGGAHRGPGRGPQPAGEVLLVRLGPLLGSHRQRPRLLRHPLRPGAGARCPTAGSRSAGAGSRSPTTPRPWPPTWPDVTSTSSPTSGSARDGVAVLTNDLTHAYIDENMGTS